MAIMILTLSLNGSVAQFGSKVVSGDVDVGRLLDNFTAGSPSLGYWDVSGNGYSADDVVYLDISSNNLTDAYDIRLISYDSNPAGTQVMAWDNDINKPLKYLHGNACGIYFLDLYDGTPGYNYEDYVYVLAHASSSDTRTITNDVRLSEVNGLAPGTRVSDFHPDHGKIATAMIAPFTTLPTGTMATIRFYNVNGNVDVLGNPIYDLGDDVYLDISLPSTSSFGFVVPNNLRLSG